MIMAIGIIAVICSACSKSNKMEMPKAETTTISEVLQGKQTVFSLENGYQVSRKGEKVCLRFEKKKFQTKGKDLAFLWQEAKKGDVVKVVATKKGWIYVPQRPSTKIADMTTEGNVKKFILEDGCQIIQKGKKITIYSSTNEKAFKLKDDEVAFLWEMAFVGQEVSWEGMSIRPVGLPQIVGVQQLKDFIIYYLSNTQEIWVDADSEKFFFLKDRSGNRIASCSSGKWYYEWLKAQKGQEVVVAEMGFWVRYDKYQKFTIIPAKLPDYQIERVIQKVTKYDGNLSEITGKLKGSSGIFGGYVNGKISGSGVGSEDFFVNIYFEEGEPISVNAKENTFWLDVEPGNVVIEKRLNGFVTYTPKL